MPTIEDKLRESLYKIANDLADQMLKLALPHMKEAGVQIGKEDESGRAVWPMLALEFDRWEDGTPPFRVTLMVSPPQEDEEETQH